MLAIVKPKLALRVKEKQFELIRLQCSAPNIPFNPLPVSTMLLLRVLFKRTIRIRIRAKLGLKENTIVCSRLYAIIIPAARGL